MVLHVKDGQGLSASARRSCTHRIVPGRSCADNSLAAYMFCDCLWVESIVYATAQALAFVWCEVSQNSGTYEGTVAVDTVAVDTQSSEKVIN